MVPKKPWTLNPGTNAAASQKLTPLTTNEKSPNVIRVRGSDNSVINGRIKVLTTAIDNAAIRAAGNVAISTPGTTRSTTSKLRAVIRPDNSDVSILVMLVLNRMFVRTMLADSYINILFIQIDIRTSLVLKIILAVRNCQIATSLG